MMEKQHQKSNSEQQVDAHSDLVIDLPGVPPMQEEAEGTNRRSEYTYDFASTTTTTTSTTSNTDERSYLLPGNQGSSRRSIASVLSDMDASVVGCLSQLCLGRGNDDSENPTVNFTNNSINSHDANSQPEQEMNLKEVGKALLKGLTDMKLSLIMAILTVAQAEAFKNMIDRIKSLVNDSSTKDDLSTTAAELSSLLNAALTIVSATDALVSTARAIKSMSINHWVGVVVSSGMGALCAVAGLWNFDVAEGERFIGVRAESMTRFNGANSGLSSFFFGMTKAIADKARRQDEHERKANQNNSTGSTLIFRPD